MDRKFRLFSTQEFSIGLTSYVPLGLPVWQAVYSNSCGHDVDLNMAYCPGCGKRTDLGVRKFEFKTVVVSDDQT